MKMQKILENREAETATQSLAPRTALSSRQKDDFTQFIIRQDFGKLGTGWTDAEAKTEADVARDIADGQHGWPLQVVAFNIAEGWSRDISEDVAKLIVNMLDPREPVSRELIDFLESAGSIYLAQPFLQAAE